MDDLPGAIVGPAVHEMETLRSRHDALTDHACTLENRLSSQGARLAGLKAVLTCERLDGAAARTQLRNDHADELRARPVPDVARRVLRLVVAPRDVGHGALLRGGGRGALVARVRRGLRGAPPAAREPLRRVRQRARRRARPRSRARGARRACACDAPRASRACAGAGRPRPRSRPSWARARSRRGPSRRAAAAAAAARARARPSRGRAVARGTRRRTRGAPPA